MSALTCCYCGKQLSGDCKCGCVGEKHADEMDRIAESAKSWEEDAKQYANNVGHWRGKYEELVDHHNATVAELQQRLQETQRALDREVVWRRQADERFMEAEQRTIAAKSGESEVIERERQHVADLIAKTEELQKQADMEMERFQVCCKRNEELETAMRCVHDTFNRDLEQGYWTKDKEFAVSILAKALTGPKS